MEKIKLKAVVRKDFGKSGCKHLRKIGEIPAVVYRGGKLGANVQIGKKDLWRALHTEAGGNAIISMDITGEEKHLKKTVIVQEIQLDPVSDEVVHVDFHEISLKEKLKVKVPVVAKGEAVGVKEEEGVLAQVVWEIEMECMPTAIPDEITVNVEGLHIGDALHIKDVEFPQDVHVLDDPEKVIASVHLPKIEEEEEKEELSEEETEEPEVIKKGKKEEEPEAGQEESSEKEAKSKGE